MDFIGSIEGMNFTPISNYNNQLKNNASFDVDSGMDFEAILNKQTAGMQDPFKIQGGIEMNKFDDIVAKNMVASSPNSDSVGNFMQNFSNSMSGGLHSVDASVKASERAQEALAMGEDISVHDVMIAAEKATLSMSMATQLRNKLITAYNEINNIRV